MFRQTRGSLPPWSFRLETERLSEKLHKCVGYYSIYRTQQPRADAVARVTEVLRKVYTTRARQQLIMLVLLLHARLSYNRSFLLPSLVACNLDPRKINTTCLSPLTPPSLPPSPPPSVPPSVPSSLPPSLHPCWRYRRREEQPVQGRYGRHHGERETARPVDLRSIPS